MRFSRVWILITIIILSFTYLSPVVHLNDLVPVFPGDDAEKIETLVTNGASEFLKSYSDALLLLVEYEISSKGSFDIASAIQKTASAINTLKNSRKKYIEALHMGEKSIYIELHKNKLKIFDYENYRDVENLNKNVADEVISFLKEGNVIGVYRRNIEKIDEIIDLLQEIDASLNNNIVPDVSLFWKLLQKYSLCSLFGTYSTLLGKKAFGDY